MLSSVSRSRALLFSVLDGPMRGDGLQTGRALTLALLSDAGHMLSDAASLCIAAFAAWAAPSPRHSYGFGRAEIVAGFVNAAFMSRSSYGSRSPWCSDCSPGG